MRQPSNDQAEMRCLIGMMYSPGLRKGKRCRKRAKLPGQVDINSLAASLFRVTKLSTK